MAKNQFLETAAEYVENIFNEKFPPENIYHSLTHTTEVVKAAEKIGKACNLEKEELEILLIAAWFHDVGYLNGAEGHEELSAKYAGDFLAKSNYPIHKIERVTNAILSTRLPQNPKNIVEEILCDADLYHVGTDEFFNKNELLRTEFERRRNKTFTDIEWIDNTIEFITNHNFFTKYAKGKYKQQKEANLLSLQKQYRKKLKKLEKEKIADRKMELEKEKFQKKKNDDKKANRGIETMFRNVMRTHVEFSGMADNKANIMITVNTLLLGAIATLLARKLDANPHLIAPTIVLSVVSLTTLIYGILATRPSITQGTFTKDDIEKKEVNLLFFGNFHKMPLNDFKWGMEAMMEDKNYLYGSMIKDFYYLGQVLGRKYHYLHICYSIFMYGMVLSIVMFIVFILLFPGGATDFGSFIE